ncbi:MAG: LiaF domain-containing protein, partial [Actinomycetota bacterium]
SRRSHLVPRRPRMKTEERQPPTAEVRRTSASRVFLGALLIAGGALWLLDEAGLIFFDWSYALPVALMLVGLVLLLGTDPRSRGLLILLGIVLSVVLAFSDGRDRRVLRQDFTRGAVGGVVERPEEAEDLRRNYNHNFGQMTLDLTQLDLEEGTTRVRARVGMGRLEVIVPEDVEFEYRATVRAGEIDGPGDPTDRRGPADSEEFESDGFDQADTRLSLNLSVGFGEIEVNVND